MRKFVKNVLEHLRDAELWLRYSDWGPFVVPSISLAVSVLALIVNLMR